MKGGELMVSKIIIHSSANVSRTLPKVMKLNRKTTIKLGNEMNFSQSYISKLAHGKAPIQFDEITNILGKLPDHQELLALEIANQITGGITPPVADGQAIKHDVEAMGRRSVRELSQAIDALAKAEDEFETSASLVRNVDDPKEAVFQGLDAIFILTNACVLIAEEYGLNYQNLAKERCKKWKALHLVS